LAEKKVRVHNLAKELSVKSQTIIEKCRAEGIEIKNHMHVVSAGLEATIREWFTPGLHASAIEDSKPIDIKAVTVKPKRSTKKTESSERDSDSQSGVAVMEPPTDEAAPPPPPAEAKPAARAPKEEPAPEPPAVVIQEAPPQEDVAPPSPPSEPEAPATPAELAPAAKQAAPKAPEVPNVAGPQNVPQPAKLSGPKLIRIDKADEVHRPRPTYRPPPRPPAGGSAPVRGLTAEEEESRRRGRGPVVRGKEGVRAADTADARANPRRSIRDTREDVNEKLREWRDRDLIERKDRLAHASGRGIGGLKAIEGKHSTRRTVGRTAQTHVRKDKVELTEPIIVKDFSRETGIPVAEIVKRLIQEHGQLANINSAIATEIAQLMALEVGIELEVSQARSATEVLRDEFAALERKKLVTRPPVVTVLGHVDHGKTSLLDRIRNAKVAAGEAGGITQHIGAYRAKVDDKYVAFLDTPGHAAFTAMRARGAHMTDVVVLVVAADDGVMPTTIEAINHAKAANTTIVVALNKIDLPHDINKIYGQLTEHGLTPSGDWGGDIDVVKTSASTGEGIEDLLNHLATLSDVLDLKADPTIPATGSVIEAERDGGQGNLAHLLVQEGTLKTGDIIVCGPAYGRVRSIRDDRAKVLKSAGPSTPVEVTGLSDIPQAGDRFYVVNDLQRAKEIAADEAMRRRETQLVRTAKPTNLETLLAGAEEGRVPTLPVIIRADVQGSVDVLRKTLAEFPTDQVRLDVLHAGVGTVTESDLVLAQASKAIILAFYVVPEPAVQKMADGLGVDIRSYRVIYNVLDDIKKALEGLLTPDEKIESRGRAEVREVFNISKVGKIAGCFIRDGVIQRSNMARVVRDGVVVRDKSAIESLRRFKDDAKEVKNGFECGIRISGFDDLKPGDVIEAFEVIKVARKL
jgi:translation initiation factor IF-2